MLTIQVVKRNLGKHVERLILNHSDSIVFSKFLIISNFDSFSENTLYIGTSDAIAKKLFEKPENVLITVAVAGYYPCIDVFLEDKTINWIITSLEVIDLCNEISTIFSDYFAWLTELQNASVENSTLNRIIDIGSHYIKRPLFLFGDTPMLMAYNNEIACNNKYFEQAIRDSYINEEGINAGVKYDFKDEKWLGFMENETGQYRLILRIKYEKLVIARLSIPIDLTDDISAVRHLTETLGKYIEILLVNRHKSEYQYNKKKAMFIASIIDNRITTEERLKAGLSFCNLKSDIYHICGLIRFFSDMHINDMMMIELLDQIIPNSHSIIYENDIIILIENNEFLAEPHFNRKMLIDLLTKYKAHIAISNPIRSLMSLSAVYGQLTHAIDFAMAFNSDSSNRLHYFKDYEIYYFIDNLVNNDIYSFHEDTLLSLIHPAFFILGRYDKENGSDFNNLLRTYYDCNCIAVEAADELFIHRNTIKYKLNKIRTIVKADINDINFRNSMLLSFAVADYITKYKNKSINY